MSSGCRFSFPVSIVTAVVCYIYISTVLVFIDKWFGLASSAGMFNAALFNFFAVMCVSSYALAIYTDPGRVPASFMPNTEDSDNPVHEIKRKDHNCFWINNCVGHKNYKSFFTAIAYAVLECVYSLVLLVGSLIAKSPIYAETSFRNIYVISGLLLVPLSLALGFLLVWHIYLITRNMTTIEYHEGVRAMWLAEKGGPLYSHPYYIGAYQNAKSILGPYILHWIHPTTKHLGSGLRFPTKYASKHPRS